MYNSKNIFYTILFIAVIILGTACERVINLHLRDDSGKLVIEGNITDLMEPQVIILTTNVSFSTPSEYPPVTGAEVSVYDDAGHQYSFKESAPGIYTSAPFAGLPDQIYHMNIETGGKTYQASSKMPVKVGLDTVMSVKKQFGDEPDERRIALKYKDPANVANQYRFLMRRNDTLINQVFSTDDRLTDGREVTYYFYISDDDIKLVVGDTIAVEMQSVDRPIYTYWSTLESQESSGPGGGVAPSNPPTNITPASLGYFSSHTTEKKTIIVK